jgi:hypothetical protein
MQWSRGKVHVNGMENIWSLLKRSIKGTYISGMSMGRHSASMSARKMTATDSAR